MCRRHSSGGLATAGRQAGRTTTRHAMAGKDEIERKGTVHGHAFTLWPLSRVQQGRGFGPYGPTQHGSRVAMFDAWPAWDACLR